MHRFLTFLLSLTVLAVPTTAWEASVSQNLAITVTQGQAITAVSLSNNSFTGGAPSGTVVGAISVTMSPASPAFSGSLSLTGTNASQFQIAGSNLATKGVVAAGTYQVNIVATESGVAGSPFIQAEAITGVSAPPPPPPSAAEMPGPSQALFNSPYYSCVRNFYVATNGSDSNNGTSPSTPWQTIANADTSSRTGGDCINVAPGSYSRFNGAISHGGTTASSTGYVAYRCTAPGFTTGNPTGGCVITDGQKSVCTGSPLGCGSAYPSYLIFDGFSFVAPAQNQWATAFTCSNGDKGPSSPGCHHWIIVNNVIAGYGQGGLQMNNSEWQFALHNRIYNNSANAGCDAGAQGSGISYGASLPVSGYNQTADDIGPTPKLGIYGNTNPNPFHQYIEWNVVYNNRMAGCGVGGSTDGNGIIIDSADQLCNGSTGVDYGSIARYLVAFNVVYNNGGGGIHTPCSSSYTISNNSVFNNRLDTDNTGTDRAGIDMDGTDRVPGGGVMENNISYAIVASGANNEASGIGGSNNIGYYNGGTSCGFSVGGVTTCGGSNITYLKNNTGSQSTCGPSEVYVCNTNPAWSCTGNKCMTEPLWVNVDSTGGNSGSAGTISTPPTGVNFALQSGSPAIGSGQTRPYLPAQSVDAGACHHTLTSCP